MLEYSCKEKPAITMDGHCMNERTGHNTGEFCAKNGEIHAIREAKDCSKEEAGSKRGNTLAILSLFKSHYFI
jgi:hypothetical protein